jgi:hypothetical protein
LIAIFAFGLSEVLKVFPFAGAFFKHEMQPTRQFPMMDCLGVVTYIQRLSDAELRRMSDTSQSRLNVAFESITESMEPNHFPTNRVDRNATHQRDAIPPANCQVAVVNTDLN